MVNKNPLARIKTNLLYDTKDGLPYRRGVN